MPPALAPPWSPVPWQVLALMEQAVSRGLRRLLRAEAAARGTSMAGPRARRQDRCGAGQAGSPTCRAAAPGCRRRCGGLVTPEQARERWRALAEFHASTGAPPRHRRALPGRQDGRGSWRCRCSATSRIRSAWARSTSSPFPIRPSCGRWSAEASGSQIQADVENVEKAGRSYKILRGRSRRGRPGRAPASRSPSTGWWWVRRRGRGGGAAREVQGGRLVVDLGRAREARSVPRRCWRWPSTAIS